MTLTTIKKFPKATEEIAHFWIPLSDGTRLAARLWRPRDAEKHPVPAILEYLPYRKTDGTVERDALTHPYLAGHGYACVRVDMRGTGDSDGVLLDEYTKIEQDDGLEVIAWIARQSWCSGAVGMMGISWGGFNALQLAARKPPALKAIVSLCSTDDRYEDDIHYKGGTLLNENMGWATTMLAYSSRPPDPEVAGGRWRKMWLERLEAEPFLIIPWLQHPLRDSYWKHGSVCENYGAIDVPALLVGGWNDAYSNAIPRLMKGLRGVRKAIIGPWAHKYPHFAYPEPRMGFLQESLRWWDQWLKGEERGIKTDPDYRIYIMDALPPDAQPSHVPGRWVGDAFWGAGKISFKKWYLTEEGIAGAAASEVPVTLSSKQSTGASSGEYCIIWGGPEFPRDQAEDDAQSLTFDTPVLRTDLDIVGQPLVEIEYAVDRPVAFVAVRLNDVWPDGRVSRLTYHVQNLCQRDSRETPSPLIPGKRYRTRIKLDDTAWRIPQGHRLRVAISTSYFPLMWPAPEPVTLTLYTGNCVLHVPVRQTGEAETALTWPAAEAATPAKIKWLAQPQHQRDVSTAPETGAQDMTILDDFGRRLIVDSGLEVSSVAREAYHILPDDPLSASMSTHWTETLQRGPWRIRTESYGKLTATRTHWIVWGKLEAFEGDKKIFSREFNEQIERRLQ